MNKLKSKITKQVKAELKEILDTNGYWSDETRDYIAQFEYIANRKLHSLAQTYDKYQYGL